MSWPYDDVPETPVDLPEMLTALAGQSSTAKSPDEVKTILNQIRDLGLSPKMTAEDTSEKARLEAERNAIFDQYKQSLEGKGSTGQTLAKLAMLALPAIAAPFLAKRAGAGVSPVAGALAGIGGVGQGFELQDELKRKKAKESAELKAKLNEMQLSPLLEKQKQITDFEGDINKEVVRGLLKPQRGMNLKDLQMMALSQEGRKKLEEAGYNLAEVDKLGKGSPPASKETDLNDLRVMALNQEGRKKLEESGYNLAEIDKLGRGSEPTPEEQAAKKDQASFERGRKTATFLEQADKKVVDNPIYKKSAETYAAVQRIIDEQGISPENIEGMSKYQLGALMMNLTVASQGSRPTDKDVQIVFPMSGPDEARKAANWISGAANGVLGKAEGEALGDMLLKQYKASQRNLRRAIPSVREKLLTLDPDMSEEEQNRLLRSTTTLGQFMKNESPKKRRLSIEEFKKLSPEERAQLTRGAS